MDKTLELIFGNQEGRTVRIMVRDPKDELSSEDIKGAMDAIVVQDVFTSSGGSLVETKGARVITRSIEEYLFQEE